MPDIIEVEVRLADTIIEMRHLATGVHRVAGIEIDAAANVMRGASPEQPIGSTWVRHRTGVVEVSARRTEAPRRHALQPSSIDRRSLGYIAASLAVHLLVWGVAGEPLERIEPEREITFYGSHPRATGTANIASGTPFQIGDSPDVETNGGGQPTMGLGAKAGGTSPKLSGHARIERRDEPRNVTRELAVEAARNAGILGSSAIKSQGFAALVGTADPASGFDTKDVQGPLFGGAGEAGGSFGLARNGFGNSAGCQGEHCNGIIGTGRYGTISNGEQVGDHWGGRYPGASTLDRGRYREAVPTVMICAGPRPCVVGVGGLDKAIIRRYVRRQLHKFEYCYEKELLAHPSLAGTVETDFLIHPDGRVAEVRAHGVSTEVAACVAGVIENIQFPRLPDGGTQVKYPFTYHSAAGR